MRKRASIFFGINLLIYCNFLTCLYGQTAAGPDRNSFSLPVDIPIFLAGNFAEPRINHFHSGIDIKTNGATGVPIKAVADGYVSRIKVEAGGYGYALYIRHPNGFTSLSGHLLSYNDEIKRYVIEEQYRRESFAVDLFPEPGKLPVKRGQMVALSGNSGSSEGPHLHFELRETQSENPVNPLMKGIVLKDNIAPVIKRITSYSLKDRRKSMPPLSMTMAKVNGLYKSASSETLALDDIAGIGIETYDLLNGSDNRCGVYRMTAYLDEEKIFESKLDEFSFSETRYMNSFMDYKAYQANRKPVLKLFIDPNNKASIYRFHRNQGHIELKDNAEHKLKIVLEDAAGNLSTAECTVRLDPSRFHHDPDFLPTYNAFFEYRETSTFTADGIEISLPPGALYDDLYFDYSTAPGTAGCFSPLHIVHHPDVPVHLYYRLAIEASNLPENIRSKALIAQYNKPGSYSSLGGTWEGNQLVTRTRNFGTFCIMVDTVKPEVRPVNFSGASDLKSLNTFKFMAKDDFSGIQSYRGEIDGKWILLEYDQKSNLLVYQFDPKRIKTGVQHTLTVRVTDQLANSNTYKISFFK